MLNKEEILEMLEKERQFAIQAHEPKMALGISQAIKVIEVIQETIDIELSKSSLEIYKKAKKEGDEKLLDSLSDVILLGVDGEIKNVLYKWLEVFGEEPDSKVCKKICELNDKGIIF